MAASYSATGGTRGRTKRISVPPYMLPYVESILDEAAPQIRQAIALRKGNESIIIPPDIVDWAQERFYIPITGKPIVLLPHQRGILRLAFTRREDGYLPYRTMIYSTIKQSGKTSIAGLILQWYGEVGRRYSTLYAIGNDQDQAKTRAFQEARISIELTPGYDHQRERLPGEWDLRNKESYRCVRTGTVIRALPVDPKGEAGGKPAIQAWTEVWGITTEEGRRFWDELTPIPTIPDSMRIVETYAGYLQESELLYEQYSTGIAGRQLTAGEFAERTGETVEAWHEANGDPDHPIPVWENRAASMLMYWDSGINARRMPWQLDERGQEYYREQETSLHAAAFRRLHLNDWVSSEANFIRSEAWDACKDEALEDLPPGSTEPLVMGVDAASTQDCFAIVLVSRHPDPQRHNTDVVVRKVKVYDPKDSGGLVDYDEAMRFIRFTCHGGHFDENQQMHPKAPLESILDPECERCRTGDWDIAGFNVVHICYDPYQLEKPMQDIRRDSVAWCEAFNQAGDRLKADRGLYDMILRRNLVHNGNKKLREHILNAGAKMQKDEDSTMRLIKLAPQRKIDAAVALSMAASRCLYLTL